MAQLHPDFWNSETCGSIQAELAALIWCGLLLPIYWYDDQFYATYLKLILRVHNNYNLFSHNFNLTTKQQQANITYH